MTPCFPRLLLTPSTVLLAMVLFGLCGCSRMSGFVMNESGQSYYKHGYYGLAQQEFNKALMDRPDNASYAYNLAAATYKLGDVATAEQMYNYALQLDPTHQPAYHGLATLMVDNGRGHEANHLLSSWAGSNPHLAEPYVELAWLQKTMGNQAGAEQSLMQALQINPQHERAIAHLGQIFEESGRQHDAMAMYQRSLYVNSHQPQVRSRMLSMHDQLAPQMAAGQYAPGQYMDGVMAGYNNPYAPMPAQMAYNGMAPGYGQPAMAPMMTQHPGQFQGMPAQNMMPASAPMGMPAVPPQAVAYQAHAGGIPAEGDVLPLAGPARAVPLPNMPVQTAAYAPQGSFPMNQGGFPEAQFSPVSGQPGDMSMLPPLPAPTIQPASYAHPADSFPGSESPELTQARPMIEAF